MQPAGLLEGLTLDDGWRVVQRIDRTSGATGGSFSVPYLVERDREGTSPETAFLKALDFSAWHEMRIPFVDAMNILTEQYIFERDLVLRCAGVRMSNVVTGVAAGQVTVLDPAGAPDPIPVPYIIFERADGDIRKVMESKLLRFDEAWAFRVLHGVANGLRQLHQEGIAHQDLKPSNVMTFDNVAKVGDLGRSYITDSSGPFDNLPLAGDCTYVRTAGVALR